VKFHDGSPWNAEAAKWNLLRMKEHPKSSAKENVYGLVSVDIVDDSTIKLNMASPSVTTLQRLTASYADRPMMMSKAAIDKYGEDWHSNHYVGTGAYEMTEWRMADRQIFKKFADYWRKGADGQPLPYLDGVEARFIPDNTVATVELRTGNLHLSNSLQSTDIAVMKANPDLVLETKVWDRSGQDMAMSAVSGVYQSNLKLRQAVQYGIDRDAMAKTMSREAGEAYNDWIPEGSVGYSPNNLYYKYDLAKAKGLMTEAGFPNGLNARLLVFQRKPDAPQSEIIQAMLANIGIKIQLDVMDKLAAVAKIKAKDYDAMTSNWGVSVDPALVLAKFFGCNGQSNWGTYCKPDFEKCLEQADVEPNVDKRSDILQRCVKILHEDAYWVNLWTELRYDVHNKKLHGWKPYDTYINFWHELWME
jgi:peptide/nickel transport system substrate-binding protein